MKSSTVLASLLFGSFAAAAPFDKRDLVYKTEVVTETVVVYTTVWDDDEPAEATTTPAGYFYEQPSSAPAVPTSSSKAPVPPPAPTPQKPSSSYVAPPPPPPSTPKPTPTPTPTPTPKPVESPKPVVPSPAPVAQSPAPVAPAPVASSPAAAPPSSGSPSTGSGGSGTFSGDITIYDNNGGFGACGSVINDSDMIVALAKESWGQSTYDRMTGASTNPWCGQKIQVFYGGKSIQATIMDMCPGCSGHDIDLSLAAWTALTGTNEKTRFKATWSKI